jgi:hypothetical protein
MAATANTNTKLPFISVLSDQELEKHIITQKSKLVNYYPLGIMDLAYDALPSPHGLSGKSGVQEPTALSTIMPKLTRIIRMRPELA